MLTISGTHDKYFLILWHIICVCVYIYIYSFLIGSKKENIIKKGIEGKIHKVRDSEQRANRNK